MFIVWFLALHNNYTVEPLNNVLLVQVILFIIDPLFGVSFNGGSTVVCESTSAYI